MPAALKDAVAVAAFHAPANTSSACAQVRGLFAPLNCATFARDYFERRHHLARGPAGRRLAAGLLRSADLPAMAAHWQFKVGEDHSQARVLLPNSFSHDDDAWPVGMALDGAGIARALAGRRTVVLHNVELYWRPIGRLCLALTQAFGVYTQANVYHSPAGLKDAVHAHQDAQSVFVVQCEGRKRWQLFAPPQRWRLRSNQRGKAGDVAPPAELQVRRPRPATRPRGPARPQG